MSDKIENITNNKSKYGVQSCDVCRFPDMPQDGRKFCSDKCKEYFLNREETKEDKQIDNNYVKHKRDVCTNK